LELAETLGLPDSPQDKLTREDQLLATVSLTDMLPTSDQLPIDSLADPELVKELLAVSDTAELTEL